MEDDSIDVFEVEGGDETEEDMPKKQRNDMHIVLIIAIIIALILIYYREHFALPMPLATSDLPYTAGADLRFLSSDSATDRGNV